MSNIDVVTEFVSKGNKYCDDCLSEKLSIRPRQQVNQIVRKLAKKEWSFNRTIRQCVNCSKDLQLIYLTKKKWKYPVG